MRRALLLGAAAVVVAAAGTLAVVLPTAPARPAGEVHITRLFIPAVKAECRERAGIGADAAGDIGYTFTPDGALTTIDRDGRFTGLEPQVLAAFNSCLAEYPIEPVPEAPRDHYSRNLLYDYFATALQPCLAGRVDDLPPMPGRADFVVRLYAWDPYRAIATRLELDELIELSAACPPLPEYLTRRSWSGSDGADRLY